MKKTTIVDIRVETEWLAKVRAAADRKGMSEYDWNILSRSFLGIPYEKTSAFAMIPTITSVSRQCLLSNKYPTQLVSPWSQSKEKSEFISCAKDMGSPRRQRRAFLKSPCGTIGRCFTTLRASSMFFDVETPMDE